MSEQKRLKKVLLPKARYGESPSPRREAAKASTPGKYPCPCCGCKTFPVPATDALAYICPVCMWENDVFTAFDGEPSDENHGLTLEEGRANYQALGVCHPRLAQYARKPFPEEFP